MGRSWLWHRVSGAAGSETFQCLKIRHDMQETQAFLFLWRLVFSRKAMRYPRSTFGQHLPLDTVTAPFAQTAAGNHRNLGADRPGLTSPQRDQEPGQSLSASVSNILVSLR